MDLSKAHQEIKMEKEKIKLKEDWDYDPEVEDYYYASDRKLKEDGQDSYDPELD